jgi:hypothetical protein
VIGCEYPRNRDAPLSTPSLGWLRGGPKLEFLRAPLRLEIMRRHKHLKQGRFFDFFLELIRQRGQPIERILVPLAVIEKDGDGLPKHGCKILIEQFDELQGPKLQKGIARAIDIPVRIRYEDVVQIIVLSQVRHHAAPRHSPRMTRKYRAAPAEMQA